MKIVQAGIAFSSERQSEQLDARISSKTEKTMKTGQHRRGINENNILSTVLVDRVSINNESSRASRSNYSAQMESSAAVTVADSDDVMHYDQKQLLEKVVGGVIDKEVAIRKISRNEDVSVGFNPSENTRVLSDGDRIQSGAGQSSADRTPLKTTQISIAETRIHFEAENTRFASQGRVLTEDGRQIDFSLNLSLDRSYLSRTEEKMLIERRQEEVVLTDPLVISLDGNAPLLTDAVFEFDLDSDGDMENINFTGTGSGFLALDKNADNVINDGSEFFGPGTGNGFGELAAYDEDGNGWIDENDTVFEKLSVWTKDEEGKDRLVSLKDAGIGAIALDHAASQFNMTGSQNDLSGQLTQSGVFLFENGNVGSVHQIDLADHDPVEDIAVSDPEFEPLEQEIGQPASAAPEVSSQAASSFESGEQTIPNPMQELIDRIEELKEKLTKFMETMNSEFETTTRAHRRSQRSYQYFQPDPSVLLGAYQGPVRSHRWYG